MGSWHVVVLNSNYSFVPTAAGSAQELWLKSDRAGASGTCILAVWHHPRFYSSTTSPLSAGTSTLPFFNVLYAAHAAVIVNGHMHDYEPFAQTAPSGNLDLANGIREVIVGTGGGGFDSPNTVIWPNSQVRISGVFGVLKLTLSSTAYSWQFVPVAGQTATDSGTTACHNAGTPPANHPPTAVPGGPYSGSEGAAVAFNGGGSSDPDGDALNYAWAFGDGTTGTGASPSHAYAGNGAYSVTLTVTDAKGAASAPATATATIANVAPAVSVPASLGANASSPVTLSATFSDPGANDAPWAYTINWGDGSAATSGSVSSQAASISASHTYAAAGTNTATVTVTDKDGAAGSGQTVVTVSQPPASATLLLAGNIARCDRTNDEATAAMLDTTQGTVFALGDNAYPNGTAATL